MFELLSDVQLKRLVCAGSSGGCHQTTENSLRTKLNEETVCPHMGCLTSICFCVFLGVKPLTFEKKVQYAGSHFFILTI